MVTRAGMVGRDAERQVLSSALLDASAGTPSAILIGGEAGAGKTSLVAEVTERLAAEGHLVLWGRCLRFGAESSPYLPIGQVLTHWFRQADDAERRRVLAGADELATVVPSLASGAAVGRPETGQLISLAAAVLDRIAETVPTVLVIDDLHWCDTTSLDLLAYLLAGFAPGQRLSVLATYRDTELVDGHRLHGWLADMRRLPSVTLMPLERLSLPETEELITRLLGPQRSADVAELFDMSGGNPYLIELLARVSIVDDRRDARITGDLREVLLASWHRLTGPTRELLQLLAVGGRPVAVDILNTLAEGRGLAGTVRACLAEASGEGIAQVSATDEAWFHHPLLSEVIAGTLPQGELTRIHHEYVNVWEAAEDLPLASRAAHLALHHDRANHHDETFTWSLRAADEAAEVLAFAEECQHLHRACLRWPEVDPAVRGTAVERVDLLRRAAGSAMQAGEHTLALELQEQALSLTNPAEDPLVAARLMIPLGWLRDLANVELMPAAEPRLAMISLTERFPESAEHAIALALLAEDEVWCARPDAAASHAAEALALAGRIGSVEAQAWALGARSQTRWSSPEGREDAEQAVELARRSGDRLLRAMTGLWLSNCLQAAGEPANAADATLALFRDLMATGSFYDALWCGPQAATFLIDVGRWREAQELLREMLSRRLQSRWGAEVRGVAAVLASRSGDLSRARQHLARAQELVPDRRMVGNDRVLAEVQVAWATGEAAKVLALVEEALPVTLRIDAVVADLLFLWAARTAADLAEQTGDRATATAQLNRIEQIRGNDPVRFAAATPQDTFRPALGSLFAAERARCHDERAALAHLWHDAAASCATAGLRWEQALALFREGQVLLAAGGNRPAAATALRTSAHIATELGARPLVDDVESLALQAHIPLDEPASPDTVSAVPAALAGLTAREREVLGHLVAGRTYPEIAATLFISEKTVSVHVSNILRKTGTSSRIEVAQMARRADETTSSDASRADPIEGAGPR